MSKDSTPILFNSQSGEESFILYFIVGSFETNAYGIFHFLTWGGLENKDNATTIVIWWSIYKQLPSHHVTVFFLSFLLFSEFNISV